MAGPPEYQSRVQLGDAPTTGIRGIPVQPVPSMPDVGAGFRALSSFGEELGKVAEKMKAAQQTTLAAQSVEGFLTKNAALKKQYSTSPDFEGAQDAYRSDADRLKLDLLADIADPTVRAQTSLQMERYVITTAGEVGNAQLLNQHKLNSDALNSIKTASVDDAVNAPTPIRRQAAAKAFHDQVGEQVKAGWIDPHVADEHIADFRNQVNVGDAAMVVKADPSHAIELLSDDNAFPALDVAQRGQMFQVAYQGEWARDHAANGAPVATAADHVAGGTLTPEWLATQRDAMSAMHFDAFARTLDAGTYPANPNPQVHAELLRQAAFDPEGAASDALTFLGNGAINRDGFGHVVATVRQIAQDEVARPWANDVRRQLVGLVAGRDDQSPASAARQAAALPTFESWLADNPDVTRAEAEAHAAGVAAQSLVDAARFDVSTMPLPKFAVAPRHSFELSHVTDVADRIQGARGRGEMSDDEFVAQADLLSRWNDALQQIAKGGS